MAVRSDTSGTLISVLLNDTQSQIMRNIETGGDLDLTSLWNQRVEHHGQRDRIL